MKIDSFLGIHNTTSKRDIPDEALQDAVDVDITNSGGLIARNAATLSKSLEIDAAYTTLDNVTYIVSGGHLYRVDASLGLYDLGETTATEFADYQGYLFTNDAKQVYRNVVTDLVVPVPVAPQVAISAGSLPAGIYHVAMTYTNADQLEGGHSEIVTIEIDDNSDILVTPVDLAGYTTNVYMTDAGGSTLYNVDDLIPLSESQYAANKFPAYADKIEYHEGRLYLTIQFGEYTEVLFSKPNRFHLYDYESDYFVITGEVLDMKSTPSGLVIGTANAIYAYQDGVVTQLADYGVVPGKSMVSMPDSSILIHSTRGICQALPFKNITEDHVSLPMGSKCAAVLMNSDGIQRYVGLHDGQGDAYNQF